MSIEFLAAAEAYALPMAGSEIAANSAEHAGASLVNLVSQCVEGRTFRTTTDVEEVLELCFAKANSSAADLSAF